MPTSLAATQRATTSFEPPGGYRFLHSHEKHMGPAHAYGPTIDRARFLVGRAKELDELDTALARTQRGVRQVVFVSGDAGIGKTSPQARS